MSQFSPVFGEMTSCVVHFWRHLPILNIWKLKGLTALNIRQMKWRQTIERWVENATTTKTGSIHRIHKWRTRGKKLVPSHESEALEGKQKLQMKTFSELAECLARIPPKITLYGLLFKYNYEGSLLLLMFSIDLLFAIKRDAYIFKETGWFCRFPKHQKLDKWTMAGEKRQTCWPKPHTETEYESQITTILYWIKLIPSLWSELLEVRWQSLANSVQI